MNYRSIARLVTASLLALLLAWLSIAGGHARQDPYPPAEATALPAVGQPESLQPIPTTYPEPMDPIGAPVGAQPAVIQPTATPEVAVAAPAMDGSGLLYLWLGFITTLIILAGAIFGSVLLFVRRNEPS